MTGIPIACGGAHLGHGYDGSLPFAAFLYQGFSATPEPSLHALTQTLNPKCRAHMVQPQSQALVSFPVEVDLGPGVPSPRESVWLSFACRLLETKLLQLLRFQFGEARSHSVFSCSPPSAVECACDAALQRTVDRCASCGSARADYRVGACALQGVHGMMGVLPCAQLVVGGAAPDLANTPLSVPSRCTRSACRPSSAGKPRPQLAVGVAAPSLATAVSVPE